MDAPCQLKLLRRHGILMHTDKCGYEVWLMHSRAEDWVHLGQLNCPLCASPSQLHDQAQPTEVRGEARAPRPLCHSMPQPCARLLAAHGHPDLPGNPTRRG